jgi:hypothetical protein
MDKLEVYRKPSEELQKVITRIAINYVPLFIAEKHLLMKNALLQQILIS